MKTENKPYSLGILVGRFQTFHTGHKMMIDRAVEICREVGVFIGSSQESGTAKNPFGFETRRAMIGDVYGDKVKVFPLPDIGVGNVSKWGEYVLDNVRDRFGVLPDLLVSGKEERRVNWFDGEIGNGISELYIPKTIDMSASKMREFLIADDAESWKAYTPPQLWDRYGELRVLAVAAKDVTETESV